MIFFLILTLLINEVGQDGKTQLRKKNRKHVCLELDAAGTKIGGILDDHRLDGCH